MKTDAGSHLGVLWSCSRQAWGRRKEKHHGKAAQGVAVDGGEERATGRGNTVMTQSNVLFTSYGRSVFLLEDGSQTLTSYHGNPS